MGAAVHWEANDKHYTEQTNYQETKLDINTLCCWTLHRLIEQTLLSALPWPKNSYQPFGMSSQM